MSKSTQIVGGLTLGCLTFFLFFIGLGITFFMMIVLAIAGLFVKPTTRVEMRKRWQTKQQNAWQPQKYKTKHQGITIDGQYDVIDS